MSLNDLGDLMTFDTLQSSNENEEPVSQENYLKYKKYTYKYNMNNKPKPEVNFEGLNKMASLGVNLVGSFIDTATPIVKEFENKMKEFETKVTSDFNKDTCENKTVSDLKALVYNQHEDNNNIYFLVELPRVRKEDCELKYIKEENILKVFAKTEPNDAEFSFLENKELEISLNLPENLIVTGSNIVAKHKNGGLYITISKNLINVNNININILD